MYRMILLFLIGFLLSCNDNDGIEERQTCPDIEVIINEPKIKDYSETFDSYATPFLYYYEIMDNQVQKQTYFVADAGTLNFIPKKEYLYLYNTCGFLEKIEEYDIGNSKDFIKNQKEYEYDHKGRLVNLFVNGNNINFSGDGLQTFEYLDNTVSYKQKYQANGQKRVVLTFDKDGFIIDYTEYAELFGSTRFTRYKYEYDTDKKLINAQKLEENGNWIVTDVFNYSALINPIGILRNRMFGRQNNTLLNCYYYGPEFATNNYLDEFIYMSENTEIFDSHNGVATRFYNYDFSVE